jgi:hypothetical protein
MAVDDKLYLLHSYPLAVGETVFFYRAATPKQLCRQAPRNALTGSWPESPPTERRTFREEGFTGTWSQLSLTNSVRRNRSSQPEWVSCGLNRYSARQEVYTLNRVMTNLEARGLLEAAVRADRLAVDPAAVGPGQKSHDIGDVFWSS